MSALLLLLLLLVLAVPVAAQDMNEMLTVSNESQSSQVTARMYNESPPNTPDLAEGTLVYRFIEIEQDAQEAGEARISFAVEQEWLEMNKVDPQDIVLNHLSEGTWTELPTRVLSEDERVVTYEAVSPGLNLFAITALSAASQNDSENVSAPSLDGEFDEDEAFLLIGLIVLLFAIGGLVALALYRRRSVREETRRGGTVRS